MEKVLTTIRHILITKSLRNKILFTIFILLVFRIIAHITIPGVDLAALSSLLDPEQNPDKGGLAGLGILSLLTGGAMERFSIVLMGLTPYINASIIMQLLAVILPSLENLKKEGEAGQNKINQYTRLLTVPLAFAQGYGMLFLLNTLTRSNTGGQVIEIGTFWEALPVLLTVVAGTILLMWLGELITEKGIGNGISILIFAGIVSMIPTQMGRTFVSADMIVWVALFIVTILLIMFIVYVSEADRRVPVIYATKKSQLQQKSFLPLKINQAGMIPIIFAISILSFPSIVAQIVSPSVPSVVSNPTEIAETVDSDTGEVITTKLASTENTKQEPTVVSKVADWIKSDFSPSNPTLIYNFVYALLIFGFTYFYVSIVFEPKKIADNIQKRSGYIPGYRPGVETEDFLGKITNRLCFWGGSFLVVIALAPLLFQVWLGGDAQENSSSAISLFISGAGLLIVVSVVLDLIRRINAHLVMHDYSKL